MANIINFLKFFKRKRSQTNPKDSSGQRTRITGPKQTANNELKGQEVMNFRLKTPQNLAETGSDPKIFNTQLTGKPTTDERERRIELVGYYLDDGDNPMTNGVCSPPQPPLRKNSKNETKVKTLMKSSAKIMFCSPNVNSNDNQIFSRNQLNSSFDTITEMTTNRVIKTDEKLQKTGQQSTEDKNEDQLKSDDNSDRDCDQIFNADFDLIDPEFSELKTEEMSRSSKRSDKSDNQIQVVSGLVPIKQIDLKTAKCFLCLRLVSKNINITVCSHIFCAECMREWIRFSQHCPQCRNFIWSYGYAIRTQSNRVYICSEKDYKVKRITKVDSFIDSLGAAYLFEAFVLNRNMSAYLDSNISAFNSNIIDLESKLSSNGNVQLNVNIRYKITQQIHKLEEFKQKKIQSDLSYGDICQQTNPQMLSFWNKVLHLRQFSEFN